MNVCTTGSHTGSNSRLEREMDASAGMAEWELQINEPLITVGPTIITLHEFIVPGLIIELHYMCSVCLN